MANTFIKLSTVTVGAGGASTIDFTSIPQTFTDLKIVASIRDNYGSLDRDGLKIEFNGSGGTAYTSRYLFGNGSAASSGTNTGAAFNTVYSINGNTATTSVFGNAEIYIPNYTSSNNKSYSVDAVTENNATSAGMGLNAALWSNTAAITSIKLSPENGTSFLQYTTATLYGIKSS